MVMEHGPFIGDIPIETSIHRGFSIAMFDYRRVFPVAGSNDLLDAELIPTNSHFFFTEK